MKRPKKVTKLEEKYDNKPTPFKYLNIETEQLEQDLEVIEISENLGTIEPKR